MSEERWADFSDADIDREFAAIVRQGTKDMADGVETGDPVERVQHAVTVSQGKPTWYLVPLRILCAMAFFMTLSLCIAAHGGVMNEARWGPATLISFCVAVGTGVCRRVARARYDRRRR